MISTAHLIKCNLIKQMRSYQFLLILASSILLGFMCVPAAADGYEIFYLGGVRGAYNSQWMGAVAAALPAILLWLPGFYLLRSQISEDKRLKTGSIIASTPISKFRYIVGKAVSNLVVLIVLQLLFITALIVMQLIRGESMEISILQYIQPFLFLTLPQLTVLSSLTVLFDVVPGIKNALGNIIFFVLWAVLSSFSISAPHNQVDFFGIGMILSQMMEGAKAYYPSVDANGGSFGYYPVKSVTPTFKWDGLVWNHDFLVSRLFWIGLAIFIVILSSFIFNRFRETGRDILHSKNKTKAIDSENMNTRDFQSTAILSPVQKVNRVNLFGLIKGELKIMLAGLSIWWYAVMLFAVGISLFIPLGENSRWLCLILLLPISIWSQTGCREKYYMTKQLILSSCSIGDKWWASWIAGVSISLLVSLGVILHFSFLSQWSQVCAWLVGTIFVPTLALTLGTLSENRKLFEGVYIAIFYFGPINGMGRFDFLGLSVNNTLFYFLLTCILLLIGVITYCLKDKHILK